MHLAEDEFVTVVQWVGNMGNQAHRVHECAVETADIFDKGPAVFQEDAGMAARNTSCLAAVVAQINVWLPIVLCVCPADEIFAPAAEGQAGLVRQHKLEMTVLSE